MIDWRQLRKLREHRRDAALQVVRTDQEVVDAREAAVRRAMKQLEDAEFSRESHWRAAADPQGLSASSLAGAALWSGVLGKRIDGERQAAAQAQQAHSHSVETLERSRALLRQASAAVQKAEEVLQRDRRQALRLEESRLESAGEDAATLSWLARRSGPGRRG
ncbi:hypothetical protein ACS5PN_26815 [Roseateles sp. NT4]|uniref:hypothetical protein n=1 Tax=Roseateles sp. NT4 TaxID=3453715 RepID=UPI003EEBD16E